MEVTNLNLIKDNRGLFFESWNPSSRIPHQQEKFVQDNISFSKRGVIRGLHFQATPYQHGKLITIIKGEIFDVAVDILINSSNYGQYKSAILKQGQQVYIPLGYAHGFQCLSKEAIIYYKLTNYYKKDSERCIIYNDKDIGIKWPIKTLNISKKDLLGFKFKDLRWN